MTMRVFLHRNLLETIRTAPVIGKKKLINTLHHLHFTDGQILVHCSDPRYHEDFVIESRFESCTDEEIFCRWPNGNFAQRERGHPLHLIVDDGLSLVLCPIQVRERNGAGFSAALPETGYLLGKRRIRRHTCRNIDVTLTQNSFLARGDLVDYTPLAFRVRLTPEPGTSFVWMNIDEPFSICLWKDGHIIYSGPCRFLRQDGDARQRELVLAPVEQKIHRYRKQKVRTPRLQLIPAPAIHFHHPFLERPAQRIVRDISFAGVSVEECDDDSVLMPGMVLPDLEIRQAGMERIVCTAQVIYRRRERNGMVRCGLAILDMDFRAYRRLSHLMVHSGDPHTVISREMEMKALWEFLFETGFIYPKKYHLIKSSREDIKETYHKLYHEDHDIEAHFTVQENDRIYGHVAILRAYQRTWMVHHLAARPFRGRRTGLLVLKNILKFFDGLYRYPSIRVDHLIFYFRPENYFPNLFFGGFARDLGNPRACSLDLFAYISRTPAESHTPLPDGWRLEPFEPRHLPELESFYRNTSGGLLLDVLRLGDAIDEKESLEEVYRRHGFLRQWRTYALVSEGKLTALIIADRASPGFNLSDLLNSIKIIVTDPSGLPWKILSAAAGSLTEQYDGATAPLMIYPATYPASEGVRIEKKYLLWILDTQYGKEYSEYMEEKTRFSLRFLLKYLLRKMAPR